MSGYYAIEFLNELDLSWKDFSKLSDDQKAALAIACFAVSEVNALMKMYTFAEHGLTGKKAIDYGILIQSHSLLRSWSAKLFEFSEFIRFRKKSNPTSDSILLEISRNQVEKFDALKQESGYGAARNLRHETTNHYLLGPVRKNLPYVPEHANCTFYIHQKTGNSFYPMGDEVVFIARMNRDRGFATNENEQIEIYKNWWEWNLSATRWLHGVHREFFKKLVLPIVGSKGLRRRDYWIDPSLVGVPEDVSLPIFLRRRS